MGNAVEKAGVGCAGESSALGNRLSKNSRHLERWARREGLQAWRVYDRDIPEFPYAIDRYGDCLHVQLFEGRRPIDDETIAAHLAVIGAVLDVPPAQLAFKLRRRQRGTSQYEKLAFSRRPFVVTERGLRFEVDLTAYLDTGLFLDHRDTRRRVGAEAGDRRLLNLFAYTGSFTCYAAAGAAAHTVTVDMSQTYQDWTRRNLALNGLADPVHHRLIRADVTDWLVRAASTRERFDLIVLDPPSFSNSKRMQASFDVQRDQLALITRSMALLAPAGILYFSTNRQGFRFDPVLADRFDCRDITADTVPLDFKRRLPHRCWRITAC